MRYTIYRGTMSCVPWIQYFFKLSDFEALSPGSPSLSNVAQEKRGSLVCEMMEVASLHKTVIRSALKVKGQQIFECSHSHQVIHTAILMLTNAMQPFLKC